MARPRASPLTNWVLPAPRSPESPSTHPLTKARPQLSPSPSVSTALFEMNVAMGGERAHAVLVADRDPVRCGNLADAVQGQVGELLSPGVEQRHRIATG